MKVGLYIYNIYIYIYIYSYRYSEVGVYEVLAGRCVVCVIADVKCDGICIYIYIYISKGLRIK